MIWKIVTIDAAFIAAFVSAGQPDQDVINAYLARTRKPMQQPKHEGVRRWYYLHSDNPRIRLATIGRPLEDFTGLAGKCIVGTNSIIGEFPGNRNFVGQRGSQLTLQPIEWLQGEADQEFTDGSTALAGISEQILDRRRIDENQRTIQRKYQWKDERTQ